MTAPQPPFFSVIIPAFNSGPKLETTLRSVLRQPPDMCEVIVMDGGSTDGTVTLLKCLGAENANLIWVSEPDLGIYDAMNKGIGLATGTYLYFLGAGDTLLPEALDRVRQSAPEEDLALVYGDAHIVSSDRLHGGGGPYTPARLIYDAPCHQSVFYSRPIFDLLGRYDTQYRVSADWAFNIKCFGDDRIQKLYLDAVIVDFEGGGVSANGADAAFLRDRPRLVRESLGIETRGSGFFAADQFLALRIAGAKSRLPRKFGRVLRWALHRLKV